MIGFRDLPDSLVKAITVTEDRNFFEHYGINVRGILRAFVRRYDADPTSPWQPTSAPEMDACSL